MTLPAFAAERRRLQLSIDIIDLLRQLAAQILKKTYILHKTTTGNDYKKANTHIHMKSHKTINNLQNYSIQQT